MSYVGLAYTIKFLWAPLIDQVKLPLLCGGSASAAPGC